MRYHWLIAALVVLSSGLAVRGEEDLRAIIERAIEARGGAERIRQATSVHKKVAGSFDFLGGKFSGEIFLDRAGKNRLVYHRDEPNNKTNWISVFDGHNGWVNNNGEIQARNDHSVSDVKNRVFADRVLGLVTLLNHPSPYVLTSLGESTIDDRKVIGIKVTAQERPECHLHFDMATGLLAKGEVWLPSWEEGKTYSVAVVLSDYREPDFAGPNEEALKGAQLGVDGPALLKVVRKQTVTAADLEKIKALIRQLGDDSFQVREKASADLAAYGSAATPLLRQGTKDPDSEIARRCEQGLQQIEQQAQGSKVVSAAIRLLALRKPDEAVPALLDYLPCAGNETLAREARAALTALALRDGNPDPALTQALQSKDPVRRAAAAAALGKDGGAYANEPGRRLYLKGFKIPMKVVYYGDGKKNGELEVTEISFFNRLDDSLFTEPTNP